MLTISRTQQRQVYSSEPVACFGRNELIREVVGLAVNLESIALTGSGGIGKTSIALTVLHHDQIRKRFGDDRWFICCDQFPPSRANFLAQLSKTIGARVKNPEDLTSLQPSLSSKAILIILDNAESILDPGGKNAQEIYSVVDELCQLKTICFLITSRTTAVPRQCKCPEIPTLSMKAACKIFYNTYGQSKREAPEDIFNGVIDHFLRCLDFHPLSLVIFATAASNNKWNYSQMAGRWKTQWARVLRTDYDRNLAVALEILLTSSIFCELGPDARKLLEVAAFFPQGIDEENLDWLFPAISNSRKTFNTFCDLSLTYRSNGFITMLAPIRDYFTPRDPQSSPLLCATKDRYFSRLVADFDPHKLEFGDTQWIASEDMNVEHLLDIFIPIDSNRGDIWDTCIHFMRHLFWHKPRQIILRSHIEALPDDHHSKPKCLFALSQLFGQLGHYAEQTKLLVRTLDLERWWGDDLQVAQTLLCLSDVSRLLGFHVEGVRQAREALEIVKRINHTTGKMQCLIRLAWLLFDEKQLDAAEEVASHAMNLATEKGQEVLVCQLHRVLGKINQSKGEKEKAIHHFETALGIASPPHWHEELFWAHLSLAELFGNEDEFDDANTHINQAKPYAGNDEYRLGRVMDLQANFWCLELRLEDAKSEALGALENYEECGAVSAAGVCRDLLKMVERAMKILPMGFRGELLETISHYAPIDFNFSA